MINAGRNLKTIEKAHEMQNDIFSFTLFGTFVVRKGGIVGTLRRKRKMSHYLLKKIDEYIAGTLKEALVHTWGNRVAI